MNRSALEYLRLWKDRRSRRPLVVRGARQVGKSTLIRLFAEEIGQRLVELNFERDPEDASLFASRRPTDILRLIEVRTGARIEPGRTLLFLDEIQAAPEALRSLRYFFEELPQLHVVTAGSLLEVALADLALPMPVGRVELLNLGPMQFEEYLDAAGHGELVRYLSELLPTESVPAAIHAKCLTHLRRYMLLGGMPAVVRAW